LLNLREDRREGFDEVEESDCREKIYAMSVILFLSRKLLIGALERMEV
jgi:hypothetical protein